MSERGLRSMRHRDFGEHSCSLRDNFSVKSVTLEVRSYDASSESEGLWIGRFVFFFGTEYG